MNSVIRDPIIKGAKRLGVDVGSSDSIENVSTQLISEYRKEVDSIEDYREKLNAANREIEQLSGNLERQSKEIENLNEINKSLTNKLSSLNETLNNAQVEAKNTGYSEGWESAKNKCEMEYRLTAENLQGEVQAQLSVLRAVSEANWSKISEFAAEIGFEIACKLIGEEYCKANGLLAILVHSIKAVMEKQTLTIRLAPQDISRLDSIKEELKVILGRNISVVSDPAVVFGGAIIECECGRWDARLDKQLLLLKETLEYSTSSVMMDTSS
ncbi:FliH/SctL family protein [Microbulbifer rhizosphaerae]|uniref:Flagellar assembly protein FliH n=1 Tax=Microbulbifer rhizosphaerae TaxID=1562603 RepID=A0A7W4ZB55_9GAMM|nr:FliH/SctL family protein [Microbulbifer rhizosphaerae]MBB3063493.1 flagellar biosynthesis/type III secretory pathway protein FliH [Microbulbifer rhizosphaerae]